MSTLLGSSSKPTYGQEWFGSGASNQHAVKLTMPAGGPWNIVRLGIWAAGKSATPTGYLCCWADSSSPSSLLRASSGFTLASRSFGLGQSDNYERDITAVLINGGSSVWVGFARTDTVAAQFGYNNDGVTHRDDQDASEPITMTGFSNHAVGSIGAYLYYQIANSLPTAPTLNSPISGAIVASQTPTLNFTPQDPDGDAHTKYTYQVDDNADFSSPVENTEVVGSLTDNVAVNRVVVSSLTRGTTYYWRVQTADAVGYGAWSAGASFQIAALPTATVTSPGNAQTAELWFSPGGSGNPKLRSRWSFSCPDGHSQASAIIKLYADSGGSPGSLLNTDNYTGTSVIFDTTYAVVENTKYHVSVQPTCSLAVQGAESAKNITRTRWSRASYYFDGGAAPSTLAVATDMTVGAGQEIVMEYTATGSTAEPSTWYSDPAPAGLARYFWHRATMWAYGAAPTSPKLNSVTWSYSASALSVDFWTLATGAVIDTATFVYGTQSLKHATNGSPQKTYQSFAVTGNTDIILSGRVKTSGDPAAELRIEDAAGTVLATVAIPASTDWARYSTPVINTGGATSLRLVLYTNASAGKSAWFDAVKPEASTVVTPWTPGFVGTAVVLDAGGVQIDAQAGGVARLKGSTGGSRDLVELAAHGLKFGGDTELYSPAVGKIVIASPADASALILGLGATQDVYLRRSAAKTLTLDSDGAGTALTKFSVPGALEVHGGTSFPASPADGDAFWMKADTYWGWAYYYAAAAKWISPPFSIPLYTSGEGAMPLAANATISRVAHPTVLIDAIMIRYFRFNYYNNGTNDASNYWTFVLKSRDGNTYTTRGTIATNGSGAGGSWQQLNVDCAVLFAGADGLEVTATKTGAPGPCYWAASVDAYLVLS
jgi:hypothetical protein